MPVLHLGVVDVPYSQPPRTYRGNTATDFYVYILYRPDGRPCYVGKGRGDRWLHHERGKGCNSHLKAIIKRSSGSLSKKKIGENLREEEAFELERATIAEIGREANGGPLVNMTDGGEGQSGYRHTEESKALISSTVKRVNAPIYAARKGQPVPPGVLNAAIQANTGRSLSAEHRKAIGDAQRGIPKSDAHKLANSLARKGRPLSAIHRANMSQAFAGRKHSAAHNAAVSASLKGKKKSAKAVAASVAAKKAALEKRRAGLVP